MENFEQAVTYVSYKNGDKFALFDINTVNWTEVEKLAIIKETNQTIDILKTSCLDAVYKIIESKIN